MCSGTEEELPSPTGHTVTVSGALEIEQSPDWQDAPTSSIMKGGLVPLSGGEAKRIEPLPFNHMYWTSNSFSHDTVTVRLD